MNIFPLTRRQVISDYYTWRIDPRTGRRFRHNATDYAYYYERIRTWCDDCQVSQFSEYNGGLWVKMDSPRYSVQIAHLSRILAVGRFPANSDVAISGNSGGLTKGPHAHIQIIDKLTNARVDPERFDFGIRNDERMFIRHPGGEIALITPEGNKFPLSAGAWEFLKRPYAITVTEQEYFKYPVVKPLAGTMQLGDSMQFERE